MDNISLIFSSYALKMSCKNLNKKNLANGKNPELQRSIICYMQALNFFDPEVTNKWIILQTVASTIAVIVCDKWERNDDDMWIEFFTIHFDNFDKQEFMTPEPDTNNPRKRVTPLSGDQVRNIVYELVIFVDMARCFKTSNIFAIKSVVNTVKNIQNSDKVINMIINNIKENENIDKKKNPEVKYFYPEAVGEALKEFYPEEIIERIVRDSK